jgi:hypothetical protein
MSDRQQTPLPGIAVAAQEIIDQTHEEERRLFEHMLDDIPFGADYLALLDEGWYWRDAAYIAWMGLPKRHRAPATKQELADMLGITIRALNNRIQRNPAIRIRGAKQVATVLFDRVDEVVEALVESASDPNYKNHPDRKLYLEMTGTYKPKLGLGLEDNRREPGDMADLSEADLLRMARIGDGEGGADDAGE